MNRLAGLRSIFAHASGGAWSILALALAAGLFAAGCGKPGAHGPAGRGGGRGGGAPPVEIARAARGDFEIRVRAIGWVEPFTTVTIRPQVSGQLQTVHFEDGQEVNAGDLLFTIDPRPFEAAVRLAEAGLTRDEAMASSAQREFERIRHLFDNQQASERELDLAQADAQSKSAQAQATRAELDRARLELAYCEIRAPLAGRAGSHLVDAGNVVRVNETDLVTINQLAPVHVSFAMAEEHLNSVRAAFERGEVPVTATLPGEETHAETGKLDFIDNQVERSTGMIRLKALFANEDRHLWAGRFVSVSLAADTLRDAVSVPATAVQAGQARPFVFVVRDDNTAEMQFVTIGPISEGRTIIAEGLRGDEVVITDGHLRVGAGSKVTPRNSLVSTAEIQPPSGLGGGSGPAGAVSGGGVQP